MKRLSVFGLALAASLLLAASAFGQENYKLESIGAPASSDLPKAVLDALAPQGERLVGDQGTVCEVWLRKTVPTNPSAAASLGVLYNALSEGTFLGVLHLPRPGADFRGQPLKAGYYTLRYALIPQDGNHMGVNPNRDAVHLAPVPADKELDKTLSFDELVKLGQLASGTPHPAFLVMAPVTGDTFPSLVKDDYGNWNLEIKLHGQSGDLPVALTLVGKWEG
jgi:hypothetical protein